MSFLRKSSLTLVSRLAVFALGFLVSAWTARLLGPEGKGAFAILILVPMLVSQFASLGINNANIYMIGQRRAAVKPMIENTLVFAIVMGSLMLVLYWSARTWIDPLVFKGIAPAVTAIAAVAFPLYFFYMVFNFLALAVDDIVAYNIPNVARPLLLLLGFAIVVPWHRLELLTATGIWVLANAAIAALSWWLLFRKERFRVRWHPQVFRQTMAYGLTTYLGVVLYLLNWRLDYILCNLLQNTKAVGYYSVAVALGELLWFVPHTLSAILLPEVARATTQESRRLTSRVCRLTLASCVVGAILLAVLARPLVSLIFGEAFLPAVPALWLLLPGIVGFALTSLLTSYVVGRGSPKVNNYAMGIAFVANLVANLWMIPRFGIQGAALASTLSYSLATIYIVWSYRRLSGATLAEIVWPRRSDLQLLRELSIWRNNRGSA